jgi:peptide/nickel transport system substrate-binding protein
MDLKRYDWARRNANPVELDLIENFAAGKISRRNFIKRGSMIGLSAGVMGSVITACGDDDDTATDGGGGGGGALQQGGSIRAAIQQGDANSGLDPLNMLDLGTYSVLSQSFEYLVGLASDGNIGPTALATAWEPNADGTVWTFTLRDNATWHDGGAVTSADVAATIDRMVIAGAGLAGVVSEGAVDSPDDTTVVINLDKANGNLPVLLSIYNPQSLITPADYSDGTTLDARPAGSGAFMLDNFDAATFTATFKANPNWWGGTPNLDEVVIQGFEDNATQVAAMLAREVDVIQQFGAVDGVGLRNDSNFTTLKPPSANHRQLWFNTQLPPDGPYADARVRQAVGYCLDRQQMVDSLFEGEALIANDHPVHPAVPFFDEAATPQRPRDIEMAKQLLSDAGYADGVSSTLQVGDIQEIPQLAAIVQQNCAEAGFNFEVGVTPNADFYGEYWCSGASWGSSPETSGPGIPCGASAEIGIVDYGHRPTPDIYFTRALQTDGDWNSSNYADADYDALVTEYQGAVEVEGQKAAVGKIQQKIQADGPAMYPYFYNYLSGHDSKIGGVEVTALGHMQFGKAGLKA